MPETVIKTIGISKKYGKFSALSDFTMEVKEGDIYALVGQNGAGKTTLLKLLSGLSLVSSGEIEMLGENSVKGLEKARSKVGCIIETPGFFPYLSAEKNLEYYRIQRGIKDISCVKRALKFVGLDNTGNKKFKNFSLGMKQRLGLALAVLDEPQVLLLDEPINGLDPMGIKEFREILKKLNKEKHTTILISSHILGELSQLATTYGFIRGGKLIQHISAADLHSKCQSYFKLIVNDTSKAQEVLKNLPVQNVEAAGEHEIDIKGRTEKPEEIIKALVENGVMVSQAYPSGMNLEQYFVNLIGGNAE